jgi:hypothetical protein
VGVQGFWLPQISTSTWEPSCGAQPPDQNANTIADTIPKTGDLSLPGEISELAFYMLLQRALSGRRKGKKMHAFLTERQNGKNT